MARSLDRERRTRDITHATARLLAQRGSAGVTLRALADELGGSITLITHIFPTRDDLYEGVLQLMLEQFDEEMARFVAIDDPGTALIELVTWSLPVADDSFTSHLQQIVVLGHADQDARIHPFLADIEQRVLGVLEDLLSELHPRSGVSDAALGLRTLTNGLTLSHIEHPDKWTRDRQLRVVNRFLWHQGLPGVGPGSRDQANS